MKHSSSSPQTVLVTGGSGFIAAHVLNSFLSRGYHVKTTVRSDASAAKIKKTHAEFLDLLSFVVVKDIEAEGAFDEAVKGVDGVIHTASPFYMSGVKDNEKELLNPAVKGTTRILESAAKQGPKISRVVITSSFAAIWNGGQGMWPEHTYTADDWNPVTWEDAKTSDNGALVYCASKTFAEKAAWKFVEDNKVDFDLSTVCPPMVYGPAAHAVESLDKLNTSSADIYRLTNGTESSVPDTSFFAFVDVRDVGEAHLRAYEVPEAGGQRYFVTGGQYTYQQVCDIIREAFPERISKTPKGETGAPIPPVYKVDASKAEKELGIKFTGLKECILDMVKQFSELEAR